jgi:hypothetical protein
MIMRNQCELRGEGVRIGYSTSSAGSAQLSFRRESNTLSFTGNEIGLHDTTIGALITVTLATTSEGVAVDVVG